MRAVFAVLKILLFLLHAGWITLIQPLVMIFTKSSASYVLPRIWHAAVCKIFGIKVEVVGSAAGGGQRIYMSNHVSYLDIPVLGSVIKGSFVAKEEVQGWALFGFLSQLQQTVFISRDRTAAKKAQLDLDQMLSAEKDLILFPEGTSTDGRDVWPFKSSLFSLVVGSSVEGLMAQPVTIQVYEVNGAPVDRDSDQDLIDLYAWHVEMDTELHEHLWRFAKLRGAKLRVIFHEPIVAQDMADRKALAKLCHERVRAGLMSGRVA